MSENNKRFKEASRKIVFLCNELADDGKVPSTWDVEEVLRDVWDDYSAQMEVAGN